MFRSTAFRPSAAWRGLTRLALTTAIGIVAGCGGGQGPSTSTSTSSDANAPTVQAAGAFTAAGLSAGVTTTAIAAIGRNFTGSTYKYNAGNPPPDSMVAVGPGHVVEIINSRFAIYDKATGALLQSSTQDAFWQSTWPATAQLANPYLVGFPASAAFDPRILYDERSGRWYAIADGGMELLAAVSNTSDPTQGWKGYQIDQHATFQFEMTATPLATLLADLDNLTDSPLPSRPLMQEFASRIAFDPNDYLVVRTIEPGLRWAVLCRFPIASGGIGGCNQRSRLVRREGDRLRVYDWPKIDFPTLGMDGDNVYVATQSGGNPFFVIPKARLQGGSPPSLGGVTVLANAPGSGSTQPLTDLDGNAAVRGLIVSANRISLEFNRINRLGCSTAPNCAVAGNVALSYYTAPDDPEQPGTRRTAHGSHELVPDEWPLTASVVLSGGFLHGMQTVSDRTPGGGTRLRYYRVQVSYDAVNDRFAFALRDDVLLPNIYGGRPIGTYYGSVAVGRDGHVVVGFSGSSASLPVSSFAAVGQLDAAGQHIVFGDPVLLKAGHADYEVGAEAGGPTDGGRNRLGDYSATVADPSDARRFWTIQEWVSGLDIWSTQITELVLPPAADIVASTRVSASIVASTGPRAAPMAFNVVAGDLYGDFNKGLALPDGGFMVTPDLQVAATAPRFPAYTADMLTLGDGRTEATEGAFNFLEDRNHLLFSHFRSPGQAAPLQFAELELRIRAGGDCSRDTVTLGNLAPIELHKIFPAVRSRGCAAGDEFSGTVNLLQLTSSATGAAYTTAELMDALVATPWSLRFTYRSNATVVLARLTLGDQPVGTSLVGDKDAFHGGDAVDTPPRSPKVTELLRFIAGAGGQHPGVDLDQPGFDRPVGLTHYVALPTGALPTSARLSFRVTGSDGLVYNDGVYFNDSLAASPLLPVVALRDLLGREPTYGELLTLGFDLAKVPVRTVDTTSGPGGHWSARPDEYRSLLPALVRDGRLDLVFSDDLVVDYSELIVTWVMPGAPPGDLTGDNLIDQNDVNIVLAAVNTPAYGPQDPRDLDHDGRITVLDARRMVLLCSRPRCAVQ